MIRPYRETDFETVTQFWFDAMNVAMPGLNQRLGHTLADAREFFQRVILAEDQLFVYEFDGLAVGYLGIHGEFIDRLYVHPMYHRRGIGQALLDYARTLSPKHLWLYTHQANKNARAFYEKNGFSAEGFGMSPPPESEPDVEYHWRK
ncbi:MAG: GNAT family N-acetyltransferase [Anaerolineales bacterium]|nr:GNAT family N-acetyltransferase [Anaerolineales bacterium]